MYKKTSVTQENLNIKCFRVNKIKKNVFFGKLTVELLAKSLVELNLPTKV